MNRFSFKIPFLSLVYDQFRLFWYKRLTSNALPIFSRGGDSSSLSVNALGRHELQVTKILKHFADNGRSNFLIDIGANIGLTSCQSGSCFDYVVLFEPNPLCTGILQTNVAISLAKESYKINHFGLGKKNETLSLYVPRYNWGGAYIVCPENHYDSNILLEKDNFHQHDIANYLVLDVEIKNADDVLKTLFEDLRLQERFSGSIKIDVEGMELEILQAIARTIPDDMEVSIVFENWTKTFPSKELLSWFNSRASLYILRQYPVGGNKSLISKLIKLLKLVYKRNLFYALEEWNDFNMKGDLVLHVSKTKSAARGRN